MNRENKKKKVVVIGGGTGTYTVLTGLRDYSDKIDISVIVSMMDNGGSNRIIRDEFGLLPTSDIRQCIVALASPDSDETLRKLFTYRYSSGIGISGMTFGNLFMAALTDIYQGDQKKAINETCELLGVRGNVIPVTYDKTNLVATYENGTKILGEHDIDEPSIKFGNSKIIALEVFPEAKVNPEAAKAIKEADLIVIGPGDLYTSILSNIVVGNISDLIRKSKAKLVYVVNLMTRYGQTNNFKASDFVHELKTYIGKYPDICFVNSSKKISKIVLKRYELEKAKPVEDDLDSFKGPSMQVIRKDIVSNWVYEKSESDKLVRSLIRHDCEKLAKELVKL
jgi:uncharacterized cofD-like protein